MVPVDAAASVVVLEFEHEFGLGFVAPNGRIVTNLHLASDEREIVAHLADGRRLPVQGVCAIDPRRDLVVLDVGLLDAPPVRGVPGRVPDEGAPVFVFSRVPEGDRLRWACATLSGAQVVAPGLTVHLLQGTVPPEASGSPVVAEDGAVLGIVTLAEGDEGPLSLMVPWRHVEPLMPQNQQLPLSALERTRRGPRREIPNHPLSLLEGSNLAGLEATTRALTGAIEVGAPAYNEGDVARCYRVYRQVARQLIDARVDCPGVQTALRDGLERARTLSDVDLQAWAMRDTFDGLLSVIEKYLRTRLGLAVAVTQGKPTMPN
ncbi:MAG: trypsin-like peptidase domain-containing protein [Myxococcaceae bacterium]|jgi:serine protease Do|nr:trypsin-like peptidase domain-containing protein [Myxococcaceae bacterium]